MAAVAITSRLFEHNRIIVFTRRKTWRKQQHHSTCKFDSACNKKPIHLMVTSLLSKSIHSETFPIMFSVQSWLCNAMSLREMRPPRLHEAVIDGSDHTYGNFVIRLYSNASSIQISKILIAKFHLLVVSDGKEEHRQNSGYFLQPVVVFRPNWLHSLFQFQQLSQDTQQNLPRCFHMMSLGCSHRHLSYHFHDSLHELLAVSRFSSVETLSSTAISREISFLFSLQKILELSQSGTLSVTADIKQQAVMND